MEPSTFKYVLSIFAISTGSNLQPCLSLSYVDTEGPLNENSVHLIKKKILILALCFHEFSLFFSLYFSLPPLTPSPSPLLPPTGC